MEQVALNRHVSPQPQLYCLCLSRCQMSRVAFLGVGTQHAASLQQTTRALVLYEQLGHGFGLGANEVRRKVLGQQRIGLGPGDGLLGVVAVFLLRT